MAKGIHDLGNGLGFIYVTDTAGSRIYESVPNSKSGARKIKGLASAVSATSVNKRGVGSITASAITGSGSITAITVDGVNQISASISYTISTTVAQLHSLIESAINGYTPGSSPNMGASFVGSKVNLLAPIELGSDLNGYAISVSSTGNATFTTVDIAGGTDNIESYDDNFGFRFYLDADYGLSDVTGSGSAVWGDKSNADEITDYVIPRSLNSAITTIDSNISSGAVTFNRKSSQSFITVANQGFATTDDLDYIGIDGFSDGDLVTLKSKFNTVGVYTNVTETGNIRKAVDAPDIKLGNDTPNAAVFAITLQLKNGFWYEVNRAESLSIGDLVDIDITTVPPIAGDSLVYNAGTGKFEPDTVGGGGGGSINSLSDVDTSTTPPTVLDVLQWDGTNWVPAAAGGGGGGANLSVIDNTTSELKVASDSGTDATLTSATTSLAGLMSAGDKTKLEFITVTGASDLDELTEDIADMITLSGVAANAENLGTFTGTVIADNQTIKAAIQALETHVQTGMSIFDLTNVSGTVAVGDLLAWDGTDFTTKSKLEENIVELGGSTLTVGYVPKANGDNTIVNSSIYSTSLTMGLFGVTSPTMSIGMLGTSDRSVGLERHTTVDTAGNVLFLYGGGATSAATNKNGGDVRIYGGTSTGTGTSSVGIYTCPAGSSGTTSNTATLKLNINGAGTAEFTTSTAASKMRIGHNLTTIFGSTTTIGVEMARIDNTYSIPLGMYSLSTGHLAIVGGNYGVRIGARPSGTYDFHIGGAQCYIVGGKAPGDGIAYQFYKNVSVADNGTATTIASFETVGAIATAAITGMHITNTCTSTTTNYALRLTASGATNNVALHVNTGVITMYTLTPKTGYDFTIASGANRKIGLGVNTLPEAVGNSLTISAGDVFAGYTNVVGGNLIMETGISSGNVGSDFIIRTCTPGASGTGTNTLSDKLIVKGNGNVGIGTSTPNAGAILDLTSSTMALLLPRLTGDGASAITPTNGMCLYVTSTNGTFTTVGFWGYEGGAWKKYTLI
jgi:hypothetical protein